MFKKSFLCLVAFGSLLTLSSCNKSEDFDLSTVLVTIKESRKDDFENNDILIEDFSWENVSQLNYGEWSLGQNIGYMTVFLKVSGTREVEEAITYFTTLDFVQSAEKNFIYSQI